MTTLSQQLREAGEKATPGAWRKAKDGDDIAIIGKPTWPCKRFGKAGEWDVATVTDMPKAGEQRANAALIVLLRNNLDTIIAALEAQEAGK